MPITQSGQKQQNTSTTKVQSKTLSSHLNNLTCLPRVLLLSCRFIGWHPTDRRYENKELQKISTEDQSPSKRCQCVRLELSSCAFAGDWVGWLLCEGLGFEDGRRGGRGRSAQFQLAYRTHHFCQVPTQGRIGHRSGEWWQPSVPLGHVSLKLRSRPGSTQRVAVRAPRPIIDKIDLFPPSLLLIVGEHFNRLSKCVQTCPGDARIRRRRERRPLGSEPSSDKGRIAGQIFGEDEVRMMVWFVGVYKSSMSLSPGLWITYWL